MGESTLNTDGSHPSHPDVTDEDIGRRTVEIRRERAIERSLELMRKHLGGQWTQLSTRDVERLHWTLGEVWGHMTRPDWEAVSFSALTIDDVKALLEVSAELSAAKHGTGRILDQMVELLKDAGQHKL